MVIESWRSLTAQCNCMLVEQSSRCYSQHNHGWLPNMLPDPSKEEGVSKKDIHEYNKQTAEVLLDT